MLSFGDGSLTDLRAGGPRRCDDRPDVRPDHGLPGARRARLPAARPLRPHAAAARGRRHPARLRHPARDESPVRGGLLAGVNHEVNRELLWRRYPTDQRGTPVRRFWDRPGGPSATDVPPMHQWAADRSLVDIAGGESNLVLLIRGELLRRYPNTVVLAIPASGPGSPSSDETMVKRAIFAGFFDPDVAFFGFDLTDDELRLGDGWFFALQEQITEPRFGLDESRPAGATAAPGRLAGHRDRRRHAVHHRRPGAVRGDERAGAGAGRRRHRRRGPVPEPGPGARARPPPHVHRGGLMPDHDLERIARPHGAGDLATELTELGAELAARRAELAELRDRPGRPPARTGRTARRRAGTRRAALHERRSELSGLVGVAARGLLDEIDPETAVEALDGKVPIALLPVRIETLRGSPTPPCTSASSPTRCTSTPTNRRSPPTSGPAPSGTGRSGGRRSTTRRGPSGRGPRSPAASAPAGRATCSTRCDRPT